MNFQHFDYLTFDCYGTLIDWETGLLNAIRVVLTSHGGHATDREILETYAELETAAETGAYKSYRNVLAEVMRGFAEKYGLTLSLSEVNSLADSIRDWRPFPDTVSALQKLRTKYKLAIISNIDDDLIAHSLRYLPIEFDAVITAQQVGSYKPSPRNFEAALARIGAPRETALHVAQSIFHDVVPAHALGLSAVWVNRRAGKEGFGATKHASATPDLEVPDLKTLADLAC